MTRKWKALLFALTFSAQIQCVLGSDNDNSGNGQKHAVPAAEAENEPKVDIPLFLPYPVRNAALWEQFVDPQAPRWKRSKAVKEQGEAPQYDGEWAVEEPTELLGIKGDMGLVVKSPARHHAISAKLDEPFDPAQGGLVFQYEVKLQENLGCGGAYAKLLTAPVKGEFSDSTPYTLMFGPDKCGEGKVHLIFRHKNPASGKATEHHLTDPPSPPVDTATHLYTVAVRSDNSFSLSIDGDERRKGSLLEDFEPPVNPPKEIDDPEDKKPEDWEDDERIPDPDAKKPEDWDENAPPMVPDANAVMPEGWLEKEPLMTEDPDAKKPEDWDDEEDGEWAAPMAPNPRCADAPGCGPWETPMVRNPDFKGEWFAPLIDNPRYKGDWAPRRIANPDYFEDLEPARLAKIDAVGFELWTMQSGITFDNIYLGHSAETAAQIADDVWKLKSDSELKVSEAMRPKPPPAHTPSPSDMYQLFKTRLLEIYRHANNFYETARSAGIVTAFKTEHMGALAIVMASIAICWLAWNVTVIFQFFGKVLFAPSGSPPQAGAAAGAATGTAASSN